MSDETRRLKRAPTKPRKQTTEEKGTNIQVVLRCRGRNEQEIAANSPVIVEPLPLRKKDILLKTTDKVYSFDHVFGQETSQSDIFNEVAEPILTEVLNGYNCTIFAYGQTGTGKTYTMEGDLQYQNGPYTPRNGAGIIPRAIHKLFHTLDSQQAEYSVKVSYIELYNEELRDLLCPSNSNLSRPLRIYEDTNNSGVIVQGIEEAIIKNVGEGIRVLQEGSKNRSIAATKCNELSSRSHCIFTLTVHIKEEIPGEEEVLKVGKLNLVDLAGSENIGRSGAENARAREAGMINQSLLTLGRVINQLVEHSVHIPYRESKLTRLLKDSLGGRTKTCIIATVSVAKMNQEEIVSTLDYASRAKNIRNRPEANQRMNPKYLLREYETTIERLKADLLATRDHKGVYLSAQSYSMLMDENMSQKDRVDELNRDLDGIRRQLTSQTNELREKTELLRDKENELEKILDRLVSLDAKQEQRIAQILERVAQSSGSLHGVEDILISLENNSDVMHGLLKQGIKAQRAFAESMNQIRDKLKEDTRQRNQQAERELAQFFNDLEGDLNNVIDHIRRVDEQWSKAYLQHLEDEEQHVEQQYATIEEGCESARDKLEEQRRRLKREYERLQIFREVEENRCEQEEKQLMGTIATLLAEFSKTRQERVVESMEEMQLAVVQQDWDTTRSTALGERMQRIQDITSTRSQTKQNQDMLTQISRHASSARSRCASYCDRRLDEIRAQEALVDTVSTQIDEANPYPDTTASALVPPGALRDRTNSRSPMVSSSPVKRKRDYVDEEEDMILTQRRVHPHENNAADNGTIHP